MPALKVPPGPLQQGLEQLSCGCPLQHQESMLLAMGLICQIVVKDFQLNRGGKIELTLKKKHSNLFCLITQLEWEGSCCLWLNNS